MRRVGVLACRKLYMSWETAVCRAYERYGAVIDNYKRGLYPPHGGLSDALLHSLAQAMDNLERGRQYRSACFAECRAAAASCARE